MSECPLGTSGCDQLVQDDFLAHDTSSHIFGALLPKEFLGPAKNTHDKVIDDQFGQNAVTQTKRTETTSACSGTDVPCAAVKMRATHRGNLRQSLPEHHTREHRLPGTASWVSIELSGSA